MPAVHVFTGAIEGRTSGRLQTQSSLSEEREDEEEEEEDEDDDEEKMGCACEMVQYLKLLSEVRDIALRAIFLSNM
ncbi:unnamed protein product [Dibothriocephalus latus]|uniref:Uncharacterized protein n=1 Tax=Dibothriocephalus latus TaxID=60516 RepID=A0A3P6NWT6_DIBLA|nr:unnamed protein product [Dibothriocephalus latus]